jgi:hypothetical protein
MRRLGTHWLEQGEVYYDSLPTLKEALQVRKQLSLGWATKSHSLAENYVVDVAEELLDVLFGLGEPQVPLQRSAHRRLSRTSHGPRMFRQGRSIPGKAPVSIVPVPRRILRDCQRCWYSTES